MITRTSQPASGAMLISEMKEFASFPKATQRYIRRSLDVAYGRRDAIECWARDEGEAASIRAQARLYKQLDHLRLQVPDDSGLDMIEPFIGMLITLSAFDLGQDRLPNFAAFRFLYERLIGASSRPWLPPLSKDFPVNVAMDLLPVTFWYSSNIQPIICPVVLTSGAGTSISGPKIGNIFFA